MRRIAAHRARDRFTALLREVERGHAFAIERDGAVVAHLVPAHTPAFRALPPHAGAVSASEPRDATPNHETRRDLGCDRDHVTVPDDVDGPLTDQTLDAFEADDPPA